MRLKILLLSLLLLPAAVGAQTYPKTLPGKPLRDLSITEINKIFREVNVELKREALTRLADDVCTKLNGAMLIAQDDNIVEKRGVGFTRLNSKTEANKITPATAFELASVSKEFTAAAVLQQVAKGNLSLQDSLRHFFPSLPYTGITIHHLLTHTSGLPEYFNFSESWFDRSRLMCNEDVVKVLEKYHPQEVFKPGENFIYTNTNYALLVLIVEKVSGEKFEDYMRKHIFEPAGMTHTFYVTERSAHTGSSIAAGHESAKAPKPEHFMDGTIGDKGLYSTVEDLFLWKKAYFQDYKILPKAWVQKATTQQNSLTTGEKPSKPYGYGWRLEESETFGHLIYHGGLWHGFQHILLYDPADNIFIVFLSNLRNGAHRGKTNEVLEVMVGV